MLKNATYNEMEKFILDNMESNYNVRMVLSEEVNDLDNDCSFIFSMHNSKFEITKHVKVENEDTEDEFIQNVIVTYDIEKL